MGIVRMIAAAETSLSEGDREISLVP
jgi:hypothetical protein